MLFRSLWLGLVLLVSIAVSMPFRLKTDMRGGAAVDISGMVQVQTMIIINLTIVVWLMQALAVQMRLL